MKKIEQEMLNAVRTRRNWRSGKMKNGSYHDEVKIDDDKVLVYLCNHHIATVYADGKTEINIDTLRKWPTVTTKSRLRALGFNIHTLDFVTYLDGVPVA